MSLEGCRLGEFEIIESLGEGGMGAVYKARQISLGRNVALKALQPSLATDLEFIARFRREAMAGVETVRIGHGIQRNRVSAGVERIRFRHVQHGRAEAMSLPRVVNRDETKDRTAVRFDIDPDGADDPPVGKKDQRMVGRVALVRMDGIVFEVVQRTLGMIFFEQAMPTDFVVASPFT